MTLTHVSGTIASPFKNYCRQACAKRSHAGIVITQWSKNERATRCPNKRENWHGRAGPLPRAKFHLYLGKNVGIQPQNCQNFEFWP